MAFKVPASNSLHSRRPEQATKARVRRLSGSMIHIELSERVLKMMGVNADDAPMLDVLLGTGVDHGLVRIVPGTMLTAARTPIGLRVQLNTRTTEGFVPGENTPTMFVDVVSNSISARSLVIRMPAEFLLAPDSTTDAVPTEETA